MIGGGHLLFDEMAELAQVEYFRQFIRQHLPVDPVIQCICFSQDAESLFPKGHVSLETIPKLVVDKKVNHVHRYGKYLWLEFPNVYMVFLFGMTGSLVYRTADGSLEFARVGKQNYSSLIQEWPSSCAKLRLLFRDNSELAFLETGKSGKMVITEHHPMQLSYISCLGFDPLVSNPSIEELYDKIQKYKSAIKTVLLNGNVIAGINNWMADEILYKAKIHPLELANVLTLNNVQSLWEATKQVVLQSLESDKYPEDWLFHIRWKKDKTQLHRRGIKTVQVGGRTTLYVASHQKLLKRQIEEHSTSQSLEDSTTPPTKEEQRVDTNAEKKRMRDVYRCLCTSERDGITQQDLYKAVSELEGEKWKDKELVKDAITLFSSNGSCISWNDFVNIYRQIQHSS